MNAHKSVTKVIYILILWIMVVNIFALMARNRVNSVATPPTPGLMARCFTRDKAGT